AAADPRQALERRMPTPVHGRTVLVGAGKASAAMARAFETAWSGPLEGLVLTRYGHAVPCDRVEIVEAGHPVPDVAGERAARRILALARSLGADDQFVFLASGGGSALLSLPAPRLTLDDKQAVHARFCARARRLPRSTRCASIFRRSRAGGSPPLRRRRGLLPWRYPTFPVTTRMSLPRDPPCPTRRPSPTLAQCLPDTASMSRRRCWRISRKKHRRHQNRVTRSSAGQSSTSLQARRYRSSPPRRLQCSGRSCRSCSAIGSRVRLARSDSSMRGSHFRFGPENFASATAWSRPPPYSCRGVRPPSRSLERARADVTSSSCSRLRWRSTVPTAFRRSPAIPTASTEQKITLGRSSILTA